MEIPTSSNFKADLLDAIYEKVYQDYESGTSVVIIIDEAQLIPAKETFEEIRLLTNFQLDYTNLITFILVGQTDLRKRLNHKAYLPLKQRIGLVLSSLSDHRRRHKKLHGIQTENGGQGRRIVFRRGIEGPVQIFGRGAEADKQRCNLGPA